MTVAFTFELYSFDEPTKRIFEDGQFTIGVRNSYARDWLENRLCLEPEWRELTDAAKGTENLMPLFIECVENNVTLGEICNTLRVVWGEYVAEGF